MGRLFSTEKVNTSCPWLFEFTLDTEDKQFTFRCANKTDRAHWVRIFNLICKMNERGLGASEFNPFDFEASIKREKATAESAPSEEDVPV